MLVVLGRGRRGCLVAEYSLLIYAIICALVGCIQGRWCDHLKGEISCLPFLNARAL